MQRFGSVIKLRAEHEEEYLRLHSDVWPGVLDQISQSGITNYSIFLRDGYLFSYFEYVGNDLEADMAKMADHPETQRWWAVCKPCQEKLPSATPDEHWSEMLEVFHLD